MNILLSIIIPCYKAKNVLERCVESILRQAFGDLVSIVSAQWLVRLSLRCFWLGQFFLRLRKFVGRLLH